MFWDDGTIISEIHCCSGLVSRYCSSSRSPPPSAFPIIDRLQIYHIQLLWSGDPNFNCLSISTIKPPPKVPIAFLFGPFYLHSGNTSARLLSQCQTHHHSTIPMSTTSTDTSLPLRLPQYHVRSLQLRLESTSSRCIAAVHGSSSLSFSEAFVSSSRSNPQPIFSRNSQPTGQ